MPCRSHHILDDFSLSPFLTGSVDREMRARKQELKIGGENLTMISISIETRTHNEARSHFTRLFDRISVSRERGKMMAWHTTVGSWLFANFVGSE